MKRTIFILIALSYLNNAYALLRIFGQQAADCFIASQYDEVEVLFRENESGKAEFLSYKMDSNSDHFERKEPVRFSLTQEYDQEKDSTTICFAASELNGDKLIIKPINQISRQVLNKTGDNFCFDAQYELYEYKFEESMMGKFFNMKQADPLVFDIEISEPGQSGGEPTHIKTYHLSCHQVDDHYGKRGKSGHTLRLENLVPTSISETNIDDSGRNFQNDSSNQELEIDSRGIGIISN